MAVTAQDFQKYVGIPYASLTGEEIAEWTAYIESVKPRMEAAAAAEAAHAAGIAARNAAVDEALAVLQYDATGRATDASAAAATNLQNAIYAEAAASSLVAQNATTQALQSFDTRTQAAIVREIQDAGERLDPPVVAPQAAAQAAAPAAAQSPRASITAQLTQLYRSVLAREPDAEGLKFWVDAAVQRGAVDNFILENWNRSAQQELADRRAKQQAAAAVVTQQAATTAIAPPARPSDMPPPVFSEAPAPITQPSRSPVDGIFDGLRGAFLLWGGVLALLLLRR